MVLCGYQNVAWRKKKKKEQLLVLAKRQTFGVKFSVVYSPGGSVEACKAGFPYWCDPVARRPLTWLLISIHREES